MQVELRTESDASARVRQRLEGAAPHGPRRGSGDAHPGEVDHVHHLRQPALDVSDLPCERASQADLG